MPACAESAPARPGQEPIRLFVSAGERSGDLRAGALLEALRRRVPELHLRGLGGTRLQACGLQSEAPLECLAVMGFAEVVGRLRFFASLRTRLVRLLAEWRPHRALLVDYPGLNLSLAKAAHRLGIPVTYYISPQVWAWGRWRIKTLRSTVDQMLVLFDFERELFEAEGIPVVHVGHPLVDEVAPTMPGAEFRRLLGIDGEILALLPGSRPQEVRRHLRPLVEASRLVSSLQPVVGLAPGISPLSIPPGIPWTHHTYDLLANAHVAVVASGTATLEAAILGTPMVVVYKTHPVSAWMAKRLLTIPHVSLVNVVARRRVVAECLQGRCTPREIAEEIERLTLPPEREAMREGLREVVRRLGPPGASERAACALAEKLRG